MHRVVINFGQVRQVGRTTAMLAIFESIIENINVRNLKHISRIMYVVRNEDCAVQLSNKIKYEVRNIGTNTKIFKGMVNNTTFSIVSTNALQLSHTPIEPPNCKCPNCGYNLNRKKAVVFLDGTVNRESDIRKHFPDSEWDLDLYLAD